MTIDVRAKITSNLGPVISASISDDYIQGNGLIKTGGSCVIKGKITPSVGDIVTFQYAKSGITRTVPRTMRVLSSFTDPFRSITTISLGCKLTYLQDIKDPIKWEALDDPENAERDPEEIATIPINASSIMNECLSALGLSATSNPLTNKFSIAEFDFGSGYVSVLNDLLVSESYCGYLNLSEQLVVVNLQTVSDSGPIITSGDLIDVGPINVGELPGDSVVVSYSTLKLKAPEDEGIDDPDSDPDEGNSVYRWGDDQATSSNSFTVAVSYEKTAGDIKQRETETFNVLETSQQSTSYEVIQYRDSEGVVKRKNVPRRREVIETKSSVSIAGGMIEQYLKAGYPAPNFGVTTYYTETYSYDSNGNEAIREGITSGSALYEIGAMGIDFAYRGVGGGWDVVAPATGTIPLSRDITKSSGNGDFTSSTTQRFVRWSSTVYGQQAIAAGRESITTAQQAASFINDVMGEGGLYLLDTRSETSKTGSREEAPMPADLFNEKYADKASGPYDSGYRTDSTSEVELAFGSESATRRTELSMPYAPDDIFTKVPAFAGHTYKATHSDAPQKAKAFGLIQNRMLLGNRSGMNIQISPEKMPSSPFDSVFIEAAGTIASYRVNAASWNMDSSGIIASTDAMFWGTAGTI